MIQEYDVIKSNLDDENDDMDDNNADDGVSNSQHDSKNNNEERRRKKQIKHNDVELYYSNSYHKYTALQLASLHGHYDIVTILLNFDKYYNVNINECIYNGMTPLHYACRSRTFLMLYDY